MSLLMEALRKAEEAKRSARDRASVDSSTDTTDPGPENVVFADSGQSDSDRISGTYPAIEKIGDTNEDSPPNPPRTQHATQPDQRDQQSANAMFLAKQIARRRRQQRQRITVLLGLLILLPVAGGLFYVWQTRFAASGGITTSASLSSRPAGEYLDTGTPAADSPADSLTETVPAEPVSPPDNGPMPDVSLAGSDRDVSDTAVYPEDSDNVQASAAEGSVEAGGTDNGAAAATAEAQTTTPPGTAGQPAESTRDQSLRLIHRDSTLIVTPELSAAYEHFLSGNLAAATAEYLQALEDDPRNREAMLGLATIYRRQGDTPSAQRLYARLLELNPRDPLARTGLIESARSADPLQRESDLRQLLEEYPALAPVSFTLGNLHASQGRWREAQNAYFDALRKARDSGSGPISPDYAFNLAISLERLGEPDLALEYYREAETLARVVAPGFDMKILHQRLQALQ